MRNLILATLSLSIIACQEQDTPENTEDTVSLSVQVDRNIDFLGNQDNKSLLLERSEQPFDDYLTNKLEELESQEEILLENLQPQKVPVDAICIYGGELDGTIDLTLDTTPNWALDLFDDADLQVQDVDSLVQPMANAQDPSQSHIIIDDVLEVTLHQEYVDVQIEANILSENGQGKLTGEWFICAQ